MVKEWNSIHTQRAFNWLQEHIKDRNLDIDINYPYMDKILNKTNSQRIQKLMIESYYLGMARGILRVENGMNKIQPLENITSE